MSLSMSRARLSAAVVRQKLADLAGRRDAAGEIEHDPAEEFLVGSERGVGNSFPLHFAEDLLVDKVPRRQTRACGRAGSPAVTRSVIAPASTDFGA